MNHSDGVHGEVSQAVYSKFNILVVSGVPHCVTDSLWFGFISKLLAIKYNASSPAAVLHTDQRKHPLKKLSLAFGP